MMSQCWKWLICLGFLCGSILHADDTVAERTTLLNQNFELYTHQEIKASNNKDKAEIDYNIGNLYTQFGEYPWAVLYYERALKHLPRDSAIKRNLAFVQGKLYLNKPSDTVMDQIFRFIPPVSQEESWRWVTGCIVLTILLASLYLWLSRRILKKVAWVTGFAAFIFLLHALYLQYFAPLEGIMVQPSYLYRGPGKQYSQVMGTPLFSGTQLKVVDVTEGGHWLKVETAQGSVGYVSYEAIRVI